MVMATLIRSARISSQRRLLGDGRPSHYKDNDSLKEDGLQNHLNEETSSEIIAQLEEALHNAQTRTEQTKAELQRLLADIESLREDAVLKGRESGYQAGYAEGSAEIDRRLGQLSRLSDHLFNAKRDTLDAAEDEMVEVIFASVTKILGDAYIDAETVVAAVKQSIKQLVNRDRLVIHLSAEDKRLLDEVANGRGEALFGAKVDIVADERIELGGSLLQTGSGGLDARLEIQMQQLRDCLLDVATRRREERSS
jgi:flagellar biosynthesis/type III secretory pathway protein FliH